MYSFMVLIFNICMVITTVWIVKMLLDTLFSKKKVKISSVLTWIAFFVYQMYIQMNDGGASIWKTILSILLVLLISLKCYQNRGKINIFSVVIFYVIWAIEEMIVFLCVNMIFSEQQAADMIGIVISKIFMIIGMYFFSMFWKKTNMEFLSTKYFVMLLFIPIGSIIIAVNVFFIDNIEMNSFFSIIIYSILLLFNILILEMFSKLSENFLLEKENIIYLQQIDLIARNTQEQKSVMENFQREKHDLTNKLIVIRNELENNSVIKVIKDIDDIIKNFNEGESICNSGNKVVDAIVNIKYAIAKEKNIVFLLKVFIPVDLPINQYDIGVVLGNALDNAIEVTGKCKEHVKEIDISMGIRKEAFIISIKNPYEHVLSRDKDGNLLSTKKDSNRHGYGVTSINKIVEKYNGDVIVEDENNEFIITIILNLK